MPKICMYIGDVFYRPRRHTCHKNGNEKSLRKRTFVTLNFAAPLETNRYLLGTNIFLTGNSELFIWLPSELREMNKRKIKGHCSNRFEYFHW